MTDEDQVGRRTSGGRLIQLVAIAITVIVGSVLISHLLGTGGASTPATAAPPVPPQHGRPIVIPKAPAGSTVIATVHATIPGYAAPKRTTPSMSIKPTWHGESENLPVIKAKPHWVDVRLPQRPNGLTAWVKDTDVTFSTTPYKILIDLAKRQLILFKHQRLTAAFPAGIGTTTDPTPTGQFFVAFFASPPSPGYGPFVMVTSGHSNAISDWESSGDALMAIHGPLGEDAAIGTSGAQISHGCVRLHLADLQQLRKIPAGTPIEVVAS
jgi:lipoprotein-anchoring transpeptidase ErfK/SrfK